MGRHARMFSAQAGKWLTAFPLLVALFLPAACETADRSSEPVVLTREDREEATALLERINELNEHGKYAEAIPQAIKVLEIVEKEKGPDHEGVGVCLNLLGGLYTSFGDYENAETTLSRALKIYGDLGKEAGSMAATTLGLLARLHMNKGEYGTAKPYALKALEIRERLEGLDHFMVSTSLNTLGEINLHLRQFDKAEELLQRAVKLRKDHENPHGLVISLNNLARLYYEEGDIASAAPLAEAALELGEYALGDSHPHLADTLALLGKIHASRGLYERAFLFIKKAQEIDFLAIDHMKGFTSETQKLQFIQKIEEDLQVFLSLVILKMPEFPYALEEGLNTVLRRKGIILEVQKQFQETLFSDDENIPGAFHRLSDVRSHLTAMAFSGPGDKSPAVYKRELERLKAEKERLEIELSGLSRSYSIYLETANARSGNVAALLDREKGQALVEIVRLTPFLFEVDVKEHWSSERYAAFILLPEKAGEVRIVDLGDADSIDKLIVQFKRKVTGGLSVTGEAVTLFAENLYTAVFHPIERELGNARYLFLSPDGNLNLIPFEVFRNPERGFLIEEYTFNYVTSGRDILGFGKKGGAAGKSLIIGDPDFDAVPAEASLQSLNEAPAQKAAFHMSYGTSSGLRFDRLPETLEEVKTIQEILGKTTTDLFTGDGATEQVLRQITGPRILHLATHGFFLRDMEIRAGASERGIISVPVKEDSQIPQRIKIANPLMQSGFVLAGANRALASPGSWDLPGVVTAEKILGLRLHGTEMVVMSACNTGEGEVKRGEGVFGLRRAFTQAGAGSLVMSMWPVPDKETRELMISFYLNILSGKMNRCDALRSAALKEMEITRDRHGYPAPLYWGAFVFMGTP